MSRANALLTPRGGLRLARCVVEDGVNYHNVNPASGIIKRALGTPGLIALRQLAQLGRWLPGVLNAERGNKSFTADVYPLGLARYIRHTGATQRFFADAAAGTLPAVSIVDPDFGAYSEENPQDISHGESFAAAVVNAVLHGPAWESTLLLWIYDEHGGYYDHVPPPSAVPPDDVPAHNWQLDRPPWLRIALKPLLGKSLANLENADAGPPTYDRYGFRIPAVIVSPYARPGFSHIGSGMLGQLLRRGGCAGRESDHLRTLEQSLQVKYRPVEVSLKRDSKRLYRPFLMCGSVAA
jgi:Phosphoesterase family